MPKAGSCPGAPLDEAAAVARVSDHPRLRLAEARARAAEASVDIPRARDPELRIGTVRLDEVLDGGPRFGVGVRARLERPGTLAAQEHEAELAARVERAERGEVELRLTGEARRAHARALAAAARVRIRERQVTLAESLAERAARAARSGAATRFDADLATLDLATAQEALARAEAEAGAADEALSEAVGAPAGCLVAAVGDVATWPAPSTPPPLDALLGRALARRGSVTTAAAAVEREETRRFVAGRERWPWFDFAQLEYVTGELDPTRWGLTVGISLPIFRFGDGRIAAADAAVSLAQARAERDVRALADEVAAARAAVMRAGHRLLAARAALASYPPERIEALRAATTTHGSGSQAADEVERAWLSLSRRELDAALALREATIALDAATGAPPAP